MVEAYEKRRLHNAIEVCSSSQLTDQYTYKVGLFEPQVPIIDGRRISRAIVSQTGSFCTFPDFLLE
jgi:hypothetical protein